MTEQEISDAFYEGFPGDIRNSQTEMQKANPTQHHETKSENVIFKSASTMYDQYDIFNSNQMEGRE